MPYVSWSPHVTDGNHLPDIIDLEDLPLLIVVSILSLFQLAEDGAWRNLI